MNISECTQCGLCKSVCPVFAVERIETSGPRGRAILINNNAFSEHLFMCSLCKRCENICPARIKISDEIKKSRKNHKTKFNEKMIENVRKYGNPFGKPGGKTSELHCC